MVTEIETQTINGNVVEPVAETFSIEDFAEMSDNNIKEERLIKAFDNKLNKMNDNELKTYSENLKNMKKAKSIKLTAYKMILNGSPVTKDRWTDEIKPYLLKTNNGKVFTSDEMITEFTDMVRDPKSPSGWKNVQKIKMTNFVKNVDKDEKENLKSVIELILGTCQLDNKTESDLKDCIAQLDITECNDVLNTEVLVQNKDLFVDFAQLNDNRIKDRIEVLDCFIKTLEMSVNFINWKTKRIAIRKSLSKQNTLESDFIKMEDKIQSKLKTDKKFASLMNIYQKYGL